MSSPVVISFCAVFLKREMQHIYRQVTGLRRYRNMVFTEDRQEEELFPYEAVARVPGPKISPWQRLWRKWGLREPSLLYRGHGDALAGLLRQHPADVMHVYFGHTAVHWWPFLRNWPHPVVVSFHGVDAMPRPHQKDYEPRMREMLAQVPVVLARSESLARGLVARGCPAEKILLNRTAVPLGDFPWRERDYPPADGGWHVVQASRFIAKKGLDLTVRAFAEFARARKGARLTLVGEGPLEEELRALAAELGVADRVAFPGFLSPAALNEILQSAQVFLHPSRLTPGGDQEGVPNSLLEAMATGLPVLGTRHGGIPEAVTHGISGWLVEEEDLTGLGAGLERLAGDPALCRELGKNAAESVRANFSPEAQAENLEAAYDLARERFARNQ
jgi:colanic acid/amylovoran biosynthesis glycosyltransferase